VLVEVGECYFVMRVCFEIVESDAREVRDDHVLREIAILPTVEVTQSLLVGGVEILATRLVFGDQHALPEKVYETAAVRLGCAEEVGPRTLAHPFDGGLEAREPATTDAEDIEKLV